MWNEKKMDLILELEDRIRVSEDVPQSIAVILADKVLNQFDDRVREGVLLWLDNKLSDDFSVEGNSIAFLREQLNVSPFMALCALDILLRDPDFVMISEWAPFSDKAIIDVQQDPKFPL